MAWVNPWHFRHLPMVSHYSVNRGTGYGLEIPVRYELVRIQKAVEWANRCVSRISDMSASKHRLLDTREKLKLGKIIGGRFF